MRAALTLAVLIGTAGAAWAESNGPVIAIPGRPGVPVSINGAGKGQFLNFVETIRHR